MVLALLAAMSVHMAVLVVVLRLREPDPLPDELADAVSVEMVPLSALRPPAPLPSPVVPAPAAEPLPGATPPPRAASPSSTPTPAPRDDMIRPTAMLSARSLANSRQTRLALRTLAADTRIEQLCGLEAMEQIHAWQRDFQPDRIVVYAMGEPTMTGNLLEANGAAFRSHALWYTVKFRCELTADHARVAGFAFAVGAPVPRDRWEDHGLPAVH